MEPGATSLEAVSPAEASLLSNLLQLYIHDLSAAFPNIEIGDDGRYAYDQLPLYWSEPGRYPFVVRHEGRVAGFVLARRGSPAVDDPDVRDIAEFFVLRRYRRAGVGRRAAFLLWQLLPGKWSVRVSEGNTGGLAFWRDVVAEVTSGTATELTRPGRTHPWRVFLFDT